MTPASRRDEYTRLPSLQTSESSLSPDHRKTSTGLRCRRSSRLPATPGCIYRCAGCRRLLDVSVYLPRDPRRRILKRRRGERSHFCADPPRRQVAQARLKRSCCPTTAACPPRIRRLAARGLRRGGHRLPTRHKVRVMRGAELQIRPRPTTGGVTCPRSTIAPTTSLPTSFSDDPASRLPRSCPVEEFIVERSG